MLRRPTPLLLVFLALPLLLAASLATTATAWPWDPTEVRVHETRAGDLWSYEEGGSSARATLLDVTQVEGATRIGDKFGVERDAIAFRTESYVDGELRRAMRCYELSGGRVAVRQDLLAGDAMGWTSSGWSTTGILGGEAQEENETLVTSFGGACARGDSFSGRTLVEGERMPLADLLPDDGETPEVLSRPATATTYEGRTALSFRWERDELAQVFDGEGADPIPEDAVLEAIFAHELPGPAYASFHGGDEEDHLILKGFVPGTGLAVPRDGTATLPERNPAVAFVAHEPHALDETALALPFPYAEAYAAMLADPLEGARAWLDAHPGALLVSASYSPGDTSSDPVEMRARGHWFLVFQEGTESHAWTITAIDGARTMLGDLALPTSTTRVTDFGEFQVSDAIDAGPPTAMPTGDAIALARSVGLDLAPRLDYHLLQDPSGAYHHVLRLSEIDPAGDDQEGQAVAIDLQEGAIDGIFAATFRRETTSGLFPPAAVIGFEAPAAEPFSALSTPTGIAASAAATAAGLGLLALAVKLVLVPLYTRLRRDRLLDNPVRARLYERVRAEPGIHRAELVDYAGIGEGATRHHLAQLVKHKLLVELAQEDAGFVRYFAAGEVPPEAARREAVLRAGSQRAVYELFAREPQLSLRDAAARLGMSAPSVHRAKKKLEGAGLLPAAPAATARVAEA